VRHHETGRQLVLDGVPAEHGLGRDAKRQRQREQREVAAKRSATPHDQRAHDGHDADQARDDPIRKLDQRVGLQRRVDVAVAARPVRAA